MDEVVDVVTLKQINEYVKITKTTTSKPVLVFLRSETIEKTKKAMKKCVKLIKIELLSL